MAKYIGGHGIHFLASSYEADCFGDQYHKKDIKGSVKNNLAFLHPNFTISLTDLHSQKSSK